MAKMTLKDAIEKAVKEWNPILAAQVVDFCWERLGWTYQQLFAEVHRLTGIDEPKWDELLYEADNELVRTWF